MTNPTSVSDDPVIPGYVEMTRTLGEGPRITAAPRHARIHLGLLLGAPGYVQLIDEDQLLLVDQVLYQITGYSPTGAGLDVVLVEDYRPGHRYSRFPDSDTQREEP